MISDEKEAETGGGGGRPIFRAKGQRKASVTSLQISHTLAFFRKEYSQNIKENLVLTDNARNRSQMLFSARQSSLQAAEAPVSCPVCSLDARPRAPRKRRAFRQGGGGPRRERAFVRPARFPRPLSHTHTQRPTMDTDPSVCFPVFTEPSVTSKMEGKSICVQRAVGMSGPRKLEETAEKGRKESPGTWPWPWAER